LQHPEDRLFTVGRGGRDGAEVHARRFLRPGDESQLAVKGYFASSTKQLNVANMGSPATFKQSPHDGRAQTTPLTLGLYYDVNDKGVEHTV
jgi:hypothetical protein